MKPIEWTEFERRVNPANATEACNRLKPLARWWLKPDVLQLADGTSQPSADLSDLPAQSGGCWILFVNNHVRTHGYRLPETDVERAQLHQSDTHRGLLQPAFLLPLIWVEDATHGENLPSSVIELADGVIDALQGIREVAGRRWGLKLYVDPEAQQVDLGGLEEFQADSGWASLAAGLWCKATGSRPEPAVWATGCWNAGTNHSASIVPVDKRTLPAKVWLAEHFGVERLFVPETQLLDARACLSGGSDGPAIGRLVIDRQGPLQALAAYLAAAKAEPGPDERFATQRDHYLRIHPLDIPQARAFYQRRLFPMIADDCRDRFEPIRRELGTPLTHLVTVLSPSWELVPLTIETAGATHCLVFHTEGLERALDQAKQRIAERGLKCELTVKTFHFDDRMDDEFLAAVREFRDLHQPPGNRLAFDLTPANKLMNYAFAFAVARQKEDWLLYLRHDYHRDYKVPDPGTERMMIWPAGATWDFSQVAHGTGSPESPYTGVSPAVATTDPE